MCSDYFEAYRECKKQWVSSSSLMDWDVKKYKISMLTG